MNHNETMYRIDLEDYACPRFVSKPKAYLGTRDEIMDLMAHLSANSYSAMRYAQTIEAVDRYDMDPEGIHIVAGQERPVLTPVEVLVKQNAVYEKAAWMHHCASKAEISAKASRLEVEQLLALSGDQLIRCAKFRFQDLAVCMPALGWIRLRGNFRGFPGVMKYSDPGCNYSTLYSEMEIYDGIDLNRAVRDTNSLKEFDYEILLDDILGEI